MTAAGLDPRLESTVAAAYGFGLMLADTAMLTMARRYVGPDVGLAAFAAVLAAFGWWARPVGLLITAGCAWLMLDGFILDRLGDLRWHGGSDVRRLLLLAGVAAVAGTLRSLQLSLRGRPRVGHLNYLETVLSEIEVRAEHAFPESRRGARPKAAPRQESPKAGREEGDA